MNASTENPQKNSPQPDNTSQKSPLSEKQRRELWLYLAVSIAAVEIIVAVGAVLYGFIASGANSDGRLSFPWISWGALSVALPCLILLAVHLAGVGLFTSRREGDEEWQKHLPERMQRIYRIIKNAPAVVVLLGVVAFGGALLTVDGLLAAIGRFAGALTPYIPHLAAALAVVLCCIVGASVWLNYRTRRLYAEYEFRREVLQKTGVIIVDKDSTALPPGGAGEIPYALVSSETMETLHKPALPPAPGGPAAQGQGNPPEPRSPSKPGPQETFTTVDVIDVTDVTEKNATHGPRS